jgi:hypothetical protein
MHLIIKKLMLLSGVFFIFIINIGAQELPPDGPFIAYHENSEIYVSGEVKNRKKHGVWEFFYESGELQAREQYNEGVATGIWKTFSPNGRLMEKKDFRHIGSLPPTSRGNPYSGKPRIR